MLTATDIVNILKAHVEDDGLAGRVAAALKPFDGKKITKRVATAVAKALPEFTVHYDANSMFHIVIWGADIPYDQRRSFLLGYASHSPNFDYQRFITDYSCCYYGAATERDARRLQQLCDPAWLGEVAATLNTLEALKRRLSELLEECPDKYAIEKLEVA